MFFSLRPVHTSVDCGFVVGENDSVRYPSDLKVIMAYFPSSHIGCVLIPLLIYNSTTSFGGILLILAHGIRSSAIFLIYYYLYQRYYSRSVLITQISDLIVGEKYLPWLLGQNGNK